ncbi:MAG: hypothetical protein FWD11_05600 [Micrococcales bacterium]|nr:hypothetical protein [Micrococcales bacterium]
MQYTDFKANGYYIGSGPVESVQPRQPPVAPNHKPDAHPTHTRTQDLSVVGDTMDAQDDDPLDEVEDE